MTSLRRPTLGSQLGRVDAGKCTRNLVPQPSSLSNSMRLATVQRIVTRHGGKVWADGAEGQGGCFFWTFAPEPTLA